jgi:HupE / UreJ protein
MRARWVRVAAGFLLWFGFGTISATAHEHDLPPAVVMDGILKINQDNADLVVRVPLDLLRSVSFPTTNGNYDLAAAGPAVAIALHALASDIRLWADNSKLSPSRAVGRIVDLSDRSFEEYESAASHIEASADPQSKIGFELGYLDTHFTYPISSPRSVFAVQSVVADDLDGLVKLVLRYQPHDGHSQVFTIVSGSDPVLLDPAWYQVVKGFAAFGVQHFVVSIDNLLILLCLIIPFQRIRRLVSVMAAFAVGYSIILIADIYNFVPAGSWLAPLAATGIAVSILYTALANILGASLRRRWMVTALFGLIYGFTFANLLKGQLQFSGSYPLMSLVSFNIGLAIGQLVVLCVFVLARALVFRGIMAGRKGIIVASALVANVAWQWMIERGHVLWETPWPEPTATGLMELARWAVAFAMVIAAIAYLSNWIDRRRPA